MNELTINYIQLFYILISFEFLIKLTFAYCVVSTSTDTKCSCSSRFSCSRIFEVNACV